MLSKGGVLVTPILLCSVLAFAIFVERMIRFFVLRKRGRTVAARVAACIQAGDFPAAKTTAHESRGTPSSPEARHQRFRWSCPLC